MLLNIGMASKTLSRATVLTRGNSLLSLQKCKQSSNAASSTSHKDFDASGNDLDDGSTDRSLKHTDKFSEGPNLSDFIAGVVPR